MPDTGAIFPCFGRTTESTIILVLLMKHSMSFSIFVTRNSFYLCQTKSFLLGHLSNFLENNRDHSVFMSDEPFFITREPKMSIEY